MKGYQKVMLEMKNRDVDTWLELSENMWLDASSHLVVIQLDRIAMTLEIEEFLEFYDRINDAKNAMFNHPGYVIGSTVVDGVEKNILLPRPDEDDYV